MKSGATRGLGTDRRDNYFYLFGALGILTIAAPVLEETLGDIGALFAELSLTITLGISLWSLQSSRPIFWGGLCLIAINVLATATWLLLESSPGGIIADLSGLAFLVLTITAAGRALFRPGPVDANKIVGALCIYVLIGVIWAVLFQLLEGFKPGSFSGLEREGHALSWRFLYFSFVTLTTLGYGDILPQTLYAQSLTYSETMLGQFYLSVLVAALVSAYLGDRDRPSDAEPQDQGPGRDERTAPSLQLSEE